MSNDDIPENARRMLVVMYDLCDGRTDKAVSKKTLYDRCNELAVMRMSGPEFVAYHRSVLDRVASIPREKRP